MSRRLKIAKSIQGKVFSFISSRKTPEPQGENDKFGRLLAEIDGKSSVPDLKVSVYYFEYLFHQSPSWTHAI